MIGLVQINNSFSNQHYFPYSVGLLQAYADRHATRREAFEFLPPIYSRLPVEEAVERLLPANVVGFSTYVWNVRLSLEIARRLKARSPGTLVVFGGPQVPDRAEGFLRAHPFVDVVCHGEGERVFLEILERSQSWEFEGVGSISYLEGERFVHHPKRDRIRDLEEIPSPYLSGVFRPLLDAAPGRSWLVLWETNRGCPFSCTFCDWGSATQSKVFRFGLERLFGEVGWFAEHGIEFVFCCDANFGILKRDLEIATYVAETKARTGHPHALSVQNTKNATERAYEIYRILGKAGLNKGVTLSLQSVDPHTLESIKRQNISSDSFQELQRRFTRDGVETYTDMILGLPGETYESFADGVSTIIESGQHNRIQFNNLSILPNAEMGDPDYQRRYGMRTVESKIINIHGALQDSEEEIPEVQDLVVATDAMPEKEWVRTRAFAWMAALLHFDKVLQIPLIVIHAQTGLGYRQLFERFSELDDPAYPVLGEVRRFFVAKARDIQKGGPEYCPSSAWLPLWWPADEYVLIRLCFEGKLGRFYTEAERLLEGLLETRDLLLPPGLLHEAVELNSELLKRPFQSKDLHLWQSYNLWELYQGTLQGKAVTLEETRTRIFVDRTSKVGSSWDEWCREVVWYGNKKGAYLYTNPVVEPQLDGHF